MMEAKRDARSSTDRCDLQRMESLIAAGDLAALEQIVLCYGPHLNAIGRRQCRTAQEADDAVQDALLAAGEHLASYRGEGSVGAWVGQMVAHACHRMQRGRKNDPALHSVDQVDALMGRQDVEREALQRVEAERLLGAVRLLSPQDQQIVLMTAVHEYTSAEASKKLGMTAAALRKRVSRLRKSLRERIDERDLKSS